MTAARFPLAAPRPDGRWASEVVAVADDLRSVVRAWPTFRSVSCGGSHQSFVRARCARSDPSENRVTRRSQERQGPGRAHPTPRPFVCRLRSWASSSEATKAHIAYAPQSLDKTALAPLAVASAQTRRRLATEPWRRIYNTKRWKDARRRALPSVPPTRADAAAATGTSSPTTSSRSKTAARRTTPTTSKSFADRVTEHAENEGRSLATRSPTIPN